MSVCMYMRTYVWESGWAVSSALFSQSSRRWKVKGKLVHELMHQHDRVWYLHFLCMFSNCSLPELMYNRCYVLPFWSANMYNEIWVLDLQWGSSFPLPLQWQKLCWFVRLLEIRYEYSFSHWSFFIPLLIQRWALNHSIKEYKYSLLTLSTSS